MTCGVTLHRHTVSLLYSRMKNLTQGRFWLYDRSSGSNKRWMVEDFDKIGTFTVR